MLIFVKTLGKKSFTLKHGVVGKYYKGAFDPKMNKREAALILSLRESANKAEIRESHRKLMMLNHPDNGI